MSASRGRIPILDDDPDVRQALEEEAAEHAQVREAHGCFQEKADRAFPLVIGNSPRMREILDVARRAAESTATILLLGESGTGKEVLSRAIHYWSARRNLPFVAVNCVALPELLLESELFGHEKGAFTSAARQKKGKFEIAYGGTVLLDEIGATKLDLQLKLLRVLQEGAFERVGGNQVLKADVRVIAATNRDLEQAIAEGKFLKDLYYRLNVVSLVLPALRERREDIPALAWFFLRKYAHETRRTITGITDEAMAALLAYTWPGNVRELENAIERAVVLGTGAQIELRDLPEQVAGIAASAPEGTGGISRDDWIRMLIREGSRNSAQNLLEIAEADVIRAVVTLVKGNKSKAARILGIDRKKVERRIKKYDI
jgi:two-component system response regulator HydG